MSATPPDPSPTCRTRTRSEDAPGFRGAARQHWRADAARRPGGLPYRAPRERALAWSGLRRPHGAILGGLLLEEGAAREESKQPTHASGLRGQHTLEQCGTRRKISRRRFLRGLQSAREPGRCLGRPPGLWLMNGCQAVTPFCLKRRRDARRLARSGAGPLASHYEYV